MIFGSLLLAVMMTIVFDGFRALALFFKKLKG